MSNRCPRCSGTLTAADDIGPGVLACGCGVFFVTADARIKLLAWLRVTEETWALILEQGKRGPACACGAVMRTSSLKGIDIDGCASCGGLLLDPGELKRLTGLEEQTTAAATASASVPEPHDLGRMFAPARQALAAFAGSSRSFQLLQVKSQVGGAVLGMAMNQPFQWTMSSGMANGTIEPDDESAARQLLAFVTRNIVSSRFMLKDARENPMLAFVRKGFVNAVVDVLYADDEAPLGKITKSVVGLSLDLVNARGKDVLRFEKRLGDIWGFSVVDPAGRKIGDVSRGFGNVEMDMSVLGGFDVERSVRRDDFTLDFHEDVPLEAKALALAATFLVAHTSSGPAGITALFN